MESCEADMSYHFFPEGLQAAASATETRRRPERSYRIDNSIFLLGGENKRMRRAIAGERKDAKLNVFEAQTGQERSESLDWIRSNSHGFSAQPSD